jgi:hypothetical protein
LSFEEQLESETMKVRQGPDVRVMTAVVSHYRHACYQNTHDAGTMPAFGVQHEFVLRATTVIHIPTPTENARKCKRVKSNGRVVRRVTYRG